MDVEWDEVVEVVIGIPFTVIDSGSDTIFSWSLNYFSYDGSSLSIDSVPCGGTSPDLCSSLFEEAYAQDPDNSIWQSPTMPVVSQTVALPDADPGEPFVTPLTATLLGISVSDPLGEWPAAWNSPGVSFPDHDGDTNPGVTSYVKTTGTSPSCGYEYHGLPNVVSGSAGTPEDEMDIVRVYLGSRSLGYFDGELSGCERITGVVAGPNNGMPLVNGRVRGCYTETNRECTQEEFEFFDSTSGESSQHIMATRFTMIRVADGISCEQVRNLDFD
jgi:hypothetical protein